MPYQLVELSPVANDLEQLGTKEKFWFYFSDDTVNLQLFKYSRPGTGEHWSESVLLSYVICLTFHMLAMIWRDTMVDSVW